MNISIKPTAERRRDFARWAVGHRIRTESQNSFAVPEDLLEQIPEEYLDGALINGQRFYGDEILLGVSEFDTNTDDDSSTDSDSDSEDEESEDDEESGADTNTETESEDEDSNSESDTDTGSTTKALPDDQPGTEVPF